MSVPGTVLTMPTVRSVAAVCGWCRCGASAATSTNGTCAPRCTGRRIRPKYWPVTVLMGRLERSGSSGGEAPRTIGLIYIFQHHAGLWDGVIARLYDRRGRACSVHLAFADGASAIRLIAILEAYRDQVLDVLDHVNPT